MKRILLVFTVLISGLVARASEVDLSPEAAQREAAQNIQSKHQKVYVIGPIADDVVASLTPEQRVLVAALPRSSQFPGGITDVSSPKVRAYAEACNQEIARRIKAAFDKFTKEQTGKDAAK